MFSLVIVRRWESGFMFSGVLYLLFYKNSSFAVFRPFSPFVIDAPENIGTLPSLNHSNPRPHYLLRVLAM